MHKESNFEHSIEQSLLRHGGYSKRIPLAFDKKLTIVPDESCGICSGYPTGR